MRKFLNRIKYDRVENILVCCEILSVHENGVIIIMLNYLDYDDLLYVMSL